MANSGTPFIDLSVRQEDERFHIGDAPNLARPVLDLSYKVADHEGQLKSFSTVTAAVQASVGAWATTAIGLGAALLAVFAIFGTYQVYFNQKMDTKIDNIATKAEVKADALDTKIDGTGKRIDSLASEIKLLPTILSREIRETARDIATISRLPAPPIIIQPQPPLQIAPPSAR